jgi:hypothetical protein
MVVPSLFRLPCFGLIAKELLPSGEETDAGPTIITMEPGVLARKVVALRCRLLVV